MRSGRAPWLMAALAWVLVVAAVGSVTYLVVDRAGEGIGDTSTSRPMAAPPTTTPTASSTSTSPRPSRTPEPTRTTTRTPRPTSVSTPAPAPTRTTTRPKATTPAPAPTRTTTAPVSRTKTFSTAGGTVVATCTDGRVRLDSVTPRNGWRFETDDEGGYVEVQFKTVGGDEEDEDEVEVKIACRSGVPTRVDD